MTVNDVALLILLICAVVLCGGLFFALIFLLFKKEKIAQVFGITATIACLVLLVLVFVMSGNTPEENNRKIADANETIPVETEAKTKTEIDLWMKSELTDFIKKSAKEISSFPATVRIKYWTLEFAREDNFYEVSCVYSSKNALGLSLERELKMFCEVIEDGTMIRANEVYLDGKRIK
jgi:hypothetical protein